jgi:hypothetical protein
LRFVLHTELEPEGAGIPELALAIDALVALPSAVNVTTFALVVAAILDAATTADSSVAPETLPAYQLPGQSPVHTTLNSSGTFATQPLKVAATRGRARLYSRIAEGAVIVIVGGMALAVIALHSQAKSPASEPTPSTSHPVLAATKELPPPPVDPRQTRAKEEIRAQLVAFSTWAKDHAGAPCPTSAELGGGLDPWGHAYALTCTEQPADQVIGIRSVGPDGAQGTDDDLASWTLDREVTALVRGTRWTVAPVLAIIQKAGPIQRSEEPARPGDHRPRWRWHPR